MEQPVTLVIIALTLLLPITTVSVVSTKLAQQRACRFIPGDAGWPAADLWDNLNVTVHGRLIATNPAAHVCHDPAYVQSRCAKLKASWGTPSVAIPDPAEFLFPYYQNQSCDPFTPQSSPCTLGNYASYTIDVRSAEDVISGVLFAGENNVRLVIKNTGHDFLGKGAGKGALSLWTHNLDGLELLSDYQSSFYCGPALKIGAGVQSGEAARFVSKHGYRIVTGSCPSIGLAGGYTQGGGHSFLSGLYGLAADNVLEWEVVVADGRHLVATPNQHADLYFALSGGGGGTFAVVVSMTMRIFEEGPVGGVSFSFSPSSAGGEENFWAAVETFHSHLPSLVDNRGISTQYVMASEIFSVFGMMAPNHTSDELAHLLVPLMSDLGQYGLTAETMGLAKVGGATFYEYYSANISPHLESSPSGITSSRMISQDNMAQNRTAIMQAIRSAAQEHFGMFGIAFNASSEKIIQPVARNAVLPAWRHMLTHVVIRERWNWTAPWDEMLSRQAVLSDVVTPLLKAATPGSGAYLNEADFQEREWQDAFYGANYGELSVIKKKYDPDGLFYGRTAVGSEGWAADGQGRLCRAKTEVGDL